MALRSPARAIAPSARSQRLAIALLAAGQTLAWAGLYYVFAALLLSWERELGWAKADLTLGLTAAVLVAAAAAPVAGQVIDAGFGRWLLGLGALGGAAALALLATVGDRLAFIAVWALIGLAQAACLYEPCFAFVTRATGGAARAAITRITLAAGFASAIAFPTGAALAATLGWRGAVLVLALAVAGLAAPMLFIGATMLDSGGQDPAPAGRRARDRAAVAAARARPEFWLIALAFSMMALNHGILLNHLMPLLVERGLGAATAVAAASTIGPMQVLGRLLMTLIAGRASALGLSMLAFAGVSSAALLLLAAGAAPVVAFSFAALQGASYGLTSILKPVVMAESLGRTGYGAIAGWLALPYLAGFAFAPYAGALLWQAGGYDLALAAAAAMGALGLLCIGTLCWLRARASRG